MAAAEEVQATPSPSALSRVVAFTLQRQVRSGRPAAPLARPPLEVNIGRSQVNVGEELVVVGASPALGDWKATAGVRMLWTQGHQWRANVKLEAGDAPVAFKFVKVGPAGPEWESGANRELDFAALQGGDLAVSAAWGQPATSRPLDEVRGSRAWTGSRA